MNGKPNKNNNKTKRLTPLFCWSKKAVAAAAGCFKVKAPAGGFDLQKKLIRLPCKLHFNLWFVQGQSNKFFSPMTAP